MPDTHPNDERIVMVVNEHWIKYVGCVSISIALILIAVLLFFVAGYTAHHEMWLSHAAYIAALLLLLTTFHWLFFELLSESLNRIVITNHRMLRVRFMMMVHEDILEVSFEKTKTVDATKRGFLQNIFNYGSLKFEMNFIGIDLVPHPNKVAKVIQEVMHGHA